MVESPFDFILCGFNELLETPLDRIPEIGVDIPIPQFHPNSLNNLLNYTISLLKRQPSLLRIKGNFHIVGDLHGSLHDLLRVFQTIDIKKGEKILFLGDYVDRGSYSTETAILLFAMFCKYPKNIYLIRGNHECAEICSVYGFYAELRQMYNDLIYVKFIETFSYLPLAAICNDYFCVHGGIAPCLSKVEQIEHVERPINEFSTNKMVHQMVWSDPNKNISGFSESERGAGAQFGQVVVDEFLNDNNLKGIIRGHSYTENGIEHCLNKKVYTVFTSSSYKFQLGNKVGILKLASENDKPKRIFFESFRRPQRENTYFYSYHEQKSDRRLEPLCMMATIGSGLNMTSGMNLSSIGSELKIGKKSIVTSKKPIPRFRSIKTTLSAKKMGQMFIPTLSKL